MTKKISRTEYLNERKMLIEAEQEGARSFDKAILTLTAGSFGLSLAFIKELNYQNFKYFLIGSFVFFILSMLSTLVSFLTSQEAHRVQISNLRKYYETGIKTEKNTSASQTGILNKVSIVAFITAITFLTLFVSLNLIGFKCL
jgi:hypothetical protein